MADTVRVEVSVHKVQLTTTMAQMEEEMEGALVPQEDTTHKQEEMSMLVETITGEMETPVDRSVAQEATTNKQEEMSMSEAAITGTAVRARPVVVLEAM